MSLEGLEENIASLKQFLQVAVSCELIPGPLQEQQTHLTTETLSSLPIQSILNITCYEL